MVRIIPSVALRFVEHETDRDTAMLEVVAKAKGIHLGEIRWSPDWKGYTFYPATDAAFAYRALAEITSQLIAMMDDWAKANGRKPTHGQSSPYRPRAKRCNAVRTPQDGAAGEICGRWLGHEGPHRQMGSEQGWEA